MFVGTNVYGWTQLAEREGRSFDRARAMADAKQAGLNGWEDAFRSVEQVSAVSADAEAAGLDMRSAYIFGAFHTDEAARETHERALDLADALIPLGVTRMIFNPQPLPDGAMKSDAELRQQANALEALGMALAERGAALQYHSHAPEMKSAAREFHHMLAATDPAAVRLCLDLHWVYRGAGDSQVALEDIIRLYAPRIGMLHLRQSRGGAWDETIGEGDIDLPLIASMLDNAGLRPLLVIEHAYEDVTPRTRNPVPAHAASVAYVSKVFGPIAGE